MASSVASGEGSGERVSSTRVRVEHTASRSCTDYDRGVRRSLIPPAALAVPAVLAVLAVGCGDASGDGSEPDDADTGTAAPETSTEGETDASEGTDSTSADTSDDTDATEDTGPPLVPGCDGGSLTVGQHELTLEHDGIERNYDVYIPPGYDPTTPTPVVFDFHAWTTGSWIQDLLSGMRAKANAEGFIVVQPNGVGQSWNAGPVCCEPANEDDVDDVGFFLAMIDALEQDACIDPTRIYADGMSNGGYMSHRLGCELADVVAAIGPVESFIGIPDCAPSRPLPVIMVTGELGAGQQAVASFEAWRDYNGCTDEPEVTLESGVFTCFTHDDCDEGVEVTHCWGEGVDHCWPSPAQPVLPCSEDLATTDELWAFFQRWTR